MTDFLYYDNLRIFNTIIRWLSVSRSRVAINYATVPFDLPFDYAQGASMGTMLRGVSGGESFIQKLLNPNVNP